jgi:hypothetical protein
MAIHMDVMMVKLDITSTSILQEKKLIFTLLSLCKDMIQDTKLALAQVVVRERVKLQEILWYHAIKQNIL